MGTLCQAFAVSPILAAVWCSTIAVIADQGLNGLDLERPECGCLSSSLMISLGAGLVLKELKALSSAAAPATVTELGSSSVGASKPDRKSTRLNSSHSQISYAVFCLKKKKTTD